MGRSIRAFAFAAAFALSVAIATALGLVIGSSRLMHLGLFPIVLLLNAIPRVTLLPLVILIFGLGPAGKIAFGVTHGIFPIIVNVVAGLRNVDPLFVNSARSMGATRLQIVRRVIFPSVISSFFAGMRLAMPIMLNETVRDAELHYSRWRQ